MAEAEGDAVVNVFEAAAPELTRAQSRGLKDEHRRLFASERILIHGPAGGPGHVFGGVDEEQKADFISFCSDPLNRVIGSQYDLTFRTRLNIIATEPLFKASFEAIRAEALARADPAYAGSDVPLNSEAASEVLPELATAYLFIYHANLQVTYNRDVSQLVGLLKARKQILLAMTASDLKVFKGRSIISLILADIAVSRSTSLGATSMSTHATPSPVPSRESSSVIVMTPPWHSPVNQQSQHFQQHQQQQQFQGPKRGRNLKFPVISCVKCQGGGHDSTRCVIPHPQCQPSWVCGTCKGVGHSARFCPSETF